MSTAMIGEASAPITVTDSRSFHVTADAKDVEGVAVWKRLREKNPNVLFIIARSCNLNVLVYEGCIDKKHNKRLNTETPVDIYWLNLEPKFTLGNRKKKIPHDRDELSWVERKLAYGAKPKMSKSVPGTYHLRMNALPTLPIKIGIDPKTSRPRAYLRLNPASTEQPTDQDPKGVLCILERIYVHVVFKVGVPDVPWLVYYGSSVLDGSPIKQKIIRKT